MFKNLIKLVLIVSQVTNIFCINEIKISVVMPVYNTEKYLKRSIQSVLDQTLNEIELICVDDASTDDSLSILEEFKEKDNRVKVFHFNKNQGPSVARNKGIEMATGEFIGFIDDDDYMDKRFYENSYKYSKNFDVVVGNFVLGTNLSSYYLPFPNWDRRGSVFDSIFRREFLNAHNVRFAINMRIAEDIKFRYDCYEYNPRITEIPDEGIYYYYKQREGSLTNFSKKYLINYNRKAKIEAKNRRRKSKKQKKEISKKKTY
ncbi:nucleotide-diphospho-sugar transferase [Neocallimastix californiae]|uniref:Nucleotide-diphospho-sugar transferase n=1 Tax=Neocallimastix californiae TaxID=1754190 RepID=A0A1Y2BKH7_9FUNG|nr:nucleotide-diphospho-sugar transferase [Neocallimastix californiae]|eukprot:ORY35278.1 nucleotide-diphospho-sugar transferase [Neocallimastix californiae]